MKVLVKKMNKDAVIPFKTYGKDFCYDVVATSCEEVAPNVYKYGIGLAFEIDRHEMTYEDSVRLIQTCFEDDTKEQYTFVGRAGIKYDESKINISIDFRPRSSVWKTGMVLSNCTGTIDELYRGEVSAVFYHIMPNMPKYEVGNKIGQIKLGFTLPMTFEVVDELTDTERGNGAYGSTGK